jgi:hypothetical protein
MKSYPVIVCFRCKGNKKPLRKCKNGLDYVCTDCIPWVGLEGPEIGNQSKRYPKV